jgi:ATP-binding cassette subfamily B protein
VAFGAGVALLIDPIVNSTSSYNELKQTEASCERVFELMAIAPTVTDPPNPVPLPALRGEIEYRGVTFAYGDNPPVLHNIHLRVWPGETVALVGGSGSGKSTLVSLLLRFYDPQAGSILLDGIDIRTVALADLRRAMALVPQDTVLFAGTIAENLAFGRTFAIDEIVEAARIANAYDFVMQLPEGFQTRVGERGINLSGGQRQRLAIARAVLRNPKILILDEATSALDAESEALVQEALQRVTVNRTTVVIAHRLATVRRCDRIFVVEQGQIVESGNHEELLQQGGRYAQLCARQFAE